MTAHILKCGLAGWCLLVFPFWIAGGSAAPAARAGPSPGARLPETLRIGVLTLFQPQEITLAAGSRPTTLHLDERPVALLPGRFCRVAKDAGGIALWQGARRLATGTRLAVAAEDVTVEVSGRRTRLRRQFHGTLTVTAGEKHLQLVVTQPLEAVVAAVVSAELSPEAPPEAAGALAVVVRSYLANHVGRHAGQGFDFCDSTHCQLFFGEQWAQWEAGRETGGALSTLGRQAAAGTQGEVLRETGGELTDAYFTACCGGRTTTPAVAFGTGQASATTTGVRCQWCRAGRFFTWTRRVDRQTLARAILPELAAAEDWQLAVAGHTPDGFVTGVVASAGSRRITLPNHRFRHMVGQRLGWNLVLSNRYAIEPHGEWLVLRGQGFGHQVGLCLAGAITQAQAGRHYRDILRYYFPKSACRPPADF
ncbi:SpoIID/LytB domain-containing protein [Chloracidobacterium sp. MS 40/45]|uniref:SpoIID/LytB domain-containing protein n=1 Tax=Chloracidobacterium aggregatum TaxID=2851959 RepID=UPI001B8C58FA|nr:SpoIID/LytB domain-containing protein [Chloracidobacterium aggregatum]QUW00401.1 SpoIID/LytB domain-containing protein [Chloracidobacterium sp. MS 40/45]